MGQYLLDIPDFGVDKAGSFSPGLWMVQYSTPFFMALSSASQIHPEFDTNMPSVKMSLGISCPVISLGSGSWHLVLAYAHMCPKSTHSQPNCEALDLLHRDIGLGVVFQEISEGV